MNKNVSILITNSLKFVPKLQKINSSRILSLVNFGNAVIGEYSLECCWRKVSIGLDNGLASSRRQAITYTNADSIPRRMYTTLGRDELIHWGRDEINVILQTTFSNVFSWMKMYGLNVKFNWSLLPKVKSTIFQHWFRKWLRKAIIWTNDDYFIWVTRPQWVKATFECWMLNSALVHHLA